VITYRLCMVSISDRCIHPRMVPERKRMSQSLAGIGSLLGKREIASCARFSVTMLMKLVEEEKTPAELTHRR